MPQLPAPGLPGRLKDPLQDRRCKEVKPPVAELLDIPGFWSGASRQVTRPMMDMLGEHLHGEGLLTQELVLEIINVSKELFQREPNMLKLNDPVTIVGDIHGQYYDLPPLLALGGNIDHTQFLFLGDYVDRGSFSIEVLTYLFALKMYRPQGVRMLRGNHESRQMTAFFNFREECEYKYDVTVYDAICDNFDCMPLAACINNQFLTVHGGLSPELKQLSDLQEVDRFQEPPEDGLMCDILWSDPTDSPPSKDAFSPNQVRGCAWIFSANHTMAFLDSNRLLTLVRAHEVQMEGYKMHKQNPKNMLPSVITVFSAPNYCDTYGNRGAVLMLDNGTLNVKQFNFTEHPYHLPNFMGVFEWSLPFVAEKITEMTQVMMTPDDNDDEYPVDTPEALGELTSWTRKSMSQSENMSLELIQKLTAHAAHKYNNSVAEPICTESIARNRERLRQKVKFAARMARMYRTLRQENDLITQLKGVCPGHRLKLGLLLDGRESLRTELDLFKFAQGIDKNNEARPSLKSSETLVRRPTIGSRPGLVQARSTLGTNTSVNTS